MTQRFCWQSPGLATMMLHQRPSGYIAYLGSQLVLSNLNFLTSAQCQPHVASWANVGQ